MSSPNTENECRLSAAGLAFVLHGRRAITKIIAKGERENLRKFLKNNKKEVIPNLYRRTYRRLVRLIDQLAHGKEIIPRLVFLKRTQLIYASEVYNSLKN